MLFQKTTPWINFWTIEGTLKKFDLDILVITLDRQEEDTGYILKVVFGGGETWTFVDKGLVGVIAERADACTAVE